MITYDEAKKWYIQGVLDASEEGSVFGDGIDADFYDQYRDQFPPADESPSGSEAWVSVEDGLPPYTDKFYYWLYSESIDNYEQGEYNHDLGYFTDKVGCRLHLVSHWKIPTPPIN